MSDETSEAIIRRITIKHPKPVPISGGHTSSIFYDCIRLTPTELARLGAQAVGDLDIGSFDMSVGVAYTGILFAGAIAGGRSVGILTTEGQLIGPSVKGKSVIVVDDVIVQGNKVKDAAKKIVEMGGKVVGYGCIIDRSQGKFSGGPIYSAHQSE